MIRIIVKKDRGCDTFCLSSETNHKVDLTIGKSDEDSTFLTIYDLYSGKCEIIGSTKPKKMYDRETWDRITENAISASEFISSMLCYSSLASANFVVTIKIDKSLETGFDTDVSTVGFIESDLLAKAIK